METTCWWTASALKIQLEEIHFGAMVGEVNQSLVYYKRNVIAFIFLIFHLTESRGLVHKANIWLHIGRFMFLTYYQVFYFYFHFHYVFHQLR